MAAGSALERVGFVLARYKDSGEEFLELLSRVKKALESSSLERIPADQIQPFPDQPRKYFNPAKIKQMSDSIDVTAQIQAGMVRKLKGVLKGTVKYELIDGERRWRGVIMIPIERRPLYKAEVLDADDEVVQFLIAGMANFNREGHAPLETADTIRRYHREFKIPMEAVADLLGISLGWAYNILGLLDLPKTVQKMLDPELDHNKQIPIVAAMRISKLKNPDEQIKLASRVMAGKITLVELRGAVLKVAETSGTPIRLRTLSPNKRWQGRNGKIEAIGRYSTDLENTLADPDVQEIMSVRRGETSDLLKQLRTAIGKLNRAESHILKVQNKK